MISIFLAVVCSVAFIIPVQSGYMYDYNIEIWEQSGEFFTFLFPLIAVVPTCWLMFYEKKNGFLSYTITRVARKKYIITKWLTVALGGAFIVFLVSFVGLLISLFVIPDVNISNAETARGAFISHYYINSPLLYGFVLSCWRFILAFLIATFAFVISLFIKNLFIILTGPFIYSILENFTLAILNVPQFRLVTSFDPSAISSEILSIGNLFIGPLILIGCIVVLILYFIYIKNTPVYDV